MWPHSFSQSAANTYLISFSSPFPTAEGCEAKLLAAVIYTYIRIPDIFSLQAHHISSTEPAKREGSDRNLRDTSAFFVPPSELLKVYTSR